MKSKLFIPFLALTLLLLGSCDKAEIKQEVQMHSITLNAITKSPAGDSQESWRKDDKISIFTNQNKVKQFQFDQTNWQPVDGKAFYSEVPGTFFGIYPAALNSNFAIPTDQSTLEKLRLANFMSTNNVQLTNYNESLNLVFRHRLAKVEITITEYKNEFSGNLPTVTNPIFRARTNVSRGSSGSTTVSNQTLNSVTPLFTKDNSRGKHKFEVIIAPSNYEKQFICEVNGIKLTANLPANLEEGKSYNFNLKVGKEMLILNTPEISEFIGGWNNEVGINYEPPKVGDYLYSDGKWGALDKSKTPVGVIFSNNTSDIDKAAGYRNGYAISMAFVKGGNGGRFKYKTSDTPDLTLHYIRGYRFQYKKVEMDGRTETIMMNDANHPAVQAALSYKDPVFASTIPGASVWFIPSFGHWYAVFVNLVGLSPDPSFDNYNYIYWNSSAGATNESASKLDKYFTVWGQQKYQKLTGDSYWTSIQMDEDKHSIFIVGGFNNSWTFKEEHRTSELLVRPAIAF